MTGPRPEPYDRSDDGGMVVIAIGVTALLALLFGLAAGVKIGDIRAKGDDRVIPGEPALFSCDFLLHPSGRLTLVGDCYDRDDLEETSP